LAFQIADDVLDYVGNRAVMGKPTYRDLRNGHLTLPILLYLQRNPLWRGRRAPDDLSDGQVARLVQAVISGGCVDSALSMARQQADQAWQEIRGLALGAHGESLQALTVFATSRAS
jgi:heptaprenyl diphosphate synthase